MNGWKQKIDDQEEAEERDRERREAEAKARQLAEQEMYKEKSRKEKETKIRTLGQQFQCHVCQKLPTLPLEVEHSSYDDWGQYDHWTTTDWSKPGDLWKCTKCGNWTCADHIHKGICQTCAEKM